MKLISSVIGIVGYSAAAILLTTVGVPLWRAFVVILITMLVTMVRDFLQPEEE